MPNFGRMALSALALLTLGSCAAPDKEAAACRTPEKSPRPIASTHTPMPYPPISSRLNEQGVTVMMVVIDNFGVPIDAFVNQTSGSYRLDAAAANYMTAHWRWQPPTEDCRPGVAAVKVAWHISDPPVPISGFKMQRGVEIMTIYTPRLHMVASILNGK